MSAGVWRRCSSCKRDIAPGAVYWTCSVSTCNRKRTGLVFCSTDCWDAHLGVVNHRESWAVEQRAPREAGADAPALPLAAPKPSAKPSAASRAPRRRIASAPAGDDLQGDAPRDVLIVASKLKAYVRARSGMNTSDRVLQRLSDEVRRLADRAIRNARRAERKTLLDRDFDS